MIQVGDVIRHKSVPVGVLDVTVLGIEPCDDDYNYASIHVGDHVRYRILDPETGEPDTVCSLEFVKVERN